MIPLCTILKNNFHSIFNKQRFNLDINMKENYSAFHHQF